MTIRGGTFPPELTIDIGTTPYAVQRTLLHQAAELLVRIAIVKEFTPESDGAGEVPKSWFLHAPWMPLMHTSSNGSSYRCG